MNKGMKKPLVTLLIIAVMIFASMQIISCGPPAAVEMRVAWWGNPTRDEMTNKVIELYMEKNPNVTISPEFVGWGGYWDKINTQAAGGDLPDVMQHDYAYLLQFVNRNLMLDLNPYVDNRTLDLSTVDETYISGGRVNGKLYGVSLGTNAICAIYDPAMLKKAGVAEPAIDWTWSDFEKIATEVYNKTGVQTVPIFTTDPRVGFENWVRQTGASFYTKDGKSLGFSDAAPLIDFLELQTRMIKAGVMINPEISFVAMSVKEGPFATEKTWVQFVWSNQVLSTQRAANKPVKVTLVPNIQGAKRPGTFLKPSMFFAIPATTPNKDEAVKFVNFFLNDPEARKILVAERGIPITPAVRDSVKQNVDPVSQQVFDFIGEVADGHASPIDPPDPGKSGEVIKLFKDMCFGVLSDAISTKDGAEKFMAQANNILSKD